LHESVKEPPSVPGRPPVEAKGEFVQVVVAIGTDSTLMGAEQTPFQEQHDALQVKQQPRG
jgi:hypothetical protein